ncbi:hypothetical protein J1605_016058 [Eschrichtius robustus]|uniref:Uncharacterized protein n=1 Tax=Eschrichtius robustus TaxID=9764 RepID=A0AB34G801_ESCRO|nr:hypothetical protein J1605_016058 [Eschrichtius robustus]
MLSRRQPEFMPGALAFALRFGLPEVSPAGNGMGTAGVELGPPEDTPTS